MHTFVVGMMLGVLIAGTVLVGTKVQRVTTWNEIVVKKGHGEYNSITGEFQFLPSCRKEIR